MSFTFSALTTMTKSPVSTCGREGRLVLAAEDARDLAREAAEGLVRRVDHEPDARLVRVGLLRGDGTGGHGGAGNYGIDGVVSRSGMRLIRLGSCESFFLGCDSAARGCGASVQVRRARGAESVHAARMPSHRRADSRRCARRRRASPWRSTRREKSAGARIRSWSDMHEADGMSSTAASSRITVLLFAPGTPGQHVHDPAGVGALGAGVCMPGLRPQPWRREPRRRRSRRRTGRSSTL